MYGPSRFISEMAGSDAGASRKASSPARSENGRSVPSPSPSGAVYRQGNLVHHPRYGRGLVVRASRRGEEWELKVDFGFDEPKILLTGYVPIRVVKERGTRADLAE